MNLIKHHIIIRDIKVLIFMVTESTELSQLIIVLVGGKKQPRLDLNFPNFDSQLLNLLQTNYSGYYRKCFDSVFKGNVHSNICHWKMFSFATAFLICSIFLLIQKLNETGWNCIFFCLLVSQSDTLILAQENVTFSALRMAAQKGKRAGKNK